MSESGIHEPLSPDGREFLAASLFLFLTILIYLPIRHAGFVYDDQAYIVQNAGIRHLVPFNFFNEPRRAAAPFSGLAQDSFRPLVTLSFALDYSLWGLNPAGYHLENLLLHMLNAVMVLIFLRRWQSPSSARLLAMAVFLWHPVQVQSVAWVSQRSTLLSSAGMLLALLFLSPPSLYSWIRLFAGWAAFGASLCCRETAVGIIPVLPLLDGLAGRRRDERHPSRPWMRYAGLFLCIAAYVVARSRLLPSWSEFEGPRNWRSDVALGLLAFSVHLGKLLCPVHLRLHYAYPAPNFWLIAGAGGIALAYGTVTAWAAIRHRCLAVGMLWIVLFLLPVLQVIPIRAFAAERYLYFSVIGFAWILGMAYRAIPRVRPLLWLGVVLYAIISVRLVPFWRSEPLLWTASLREDPHDAYAQNAYIRSRWKERFDHANN